MARTHDIAILGATAAGYASAIALAKRRRDVVLLAGGGSAVESPLSDWIPSDVFADCAALRPVKTSGTERPFRGVQFHSAGLDRQAAHRGRAAAGYFLHPDKLLAALKSAARSAGVKFPACPQPAQVELREACVILHAKREVRARLLLFAHSSPAEVMAKLALPGRMVLTGELTLCGLDLPLTPPQRQKLDKDLHLVGLAGSNRLGVFFVAGKLLHVRILFPSEEISPAQAGEALSRLVRGLQANALLPAKLNLARAVGALWRPPGGVALELETHLTKRTLLVGTAGGFASALTGQTLAPSIRSAMAAAEVAGRALDSDDPQDVLDEYKALWRDQLADRIRPPGTSIRMLMPMALSNKAIAARFARAFLYGEPI